MKRRLRLKKRENVSNLIFHDDAPLQDAASRNPKLIALILQRGISLLEHLPSVGKCDEFGGRIEALVSPIISIKIRF
jgi:hypothetical protein